MLYFEHLNLSDTSNLKVDKYLNGFMVHTLHAEHRCLYC